MKTSLKILSTSAASLIAVGIFAGLTTEAQAVNFVWDGGSNTWDNGVTGTWNTGGTWTNGITSVAQFTGGTGTVTIGSPLEIGAIEFSGVGTAYTFDNPTGYNLDFTGAGISSTVVGGPGQAFINTFGGSVNFTNSATAGDSTIALSGAGGSLTFDMSANAGSAVINNQSGDVSFFGTSSASASTINNSGPGFVTFYDSTSGGTANINNGGTLTLDFNTASPVSLGTLNNSFGGVGGDVSLGLNTLQLSEGLTLGNVSGQMLTFELDSPAAGGKIVLDLGATFTGSGTGQVAIEITDIDSSGAVGLLGTTYTLIDWSAINPGMSAAFNTSNGIELADFSLNGGSLPPSLAGAYLSILDNNKLVLVAVPEPATMAMPFAAALGMLWLRRRTSRMTS